jgi:hypothetical protein
MDGHFAPYRAAVRLGITDRALQMRRAADQLERKRCSGATLHDEPLPTVCVQSVRDVI